MSTQQIIEGWENGVEPYKTRQAKIESGRIWQAYPDDKPDTILFEGSKTACLKYQRTLKGNVRIGKLIWEISGA